MIIFSFIKPFVELFPNIPAITYIYTLKSLLRDCEGILDIGCGSSSPLRYIECKKSVGVDIYKPALEQAEKNNTHGKFYLCSNKGLSKKFKPKQFDCCVGLDFIEHLPKKEGFKLVKDMEILAQKKIVIFTPNGFLPQHDEHNSYQNHQSGWTVDEMKNLGFNVIGMFGDKFLKGEGYGLRFKPKFLWALVSELTQYSYIRYFPGRAAAILCIKNLDK